MDLSPFPLFGDYMFQFVYLSRSEERVFWIMILSGWVPRQRGVAHRLDYSEGGSVAGGFQVHGTWPR